MNDTRNMSEVQLKIMEDMNTYKTTVDREGVAVAYYNAVRSLSIYPPGTYYPALKLTGELLSEVRPALASIGRGRLMALYPEIGDSMFYICAICHEWGIPFIALYGCATGKPDWDQVIEAIGVICEHTGKQVRGNEPIEHRRSMIFPKLLIVKQYLCTLAEADGWKIESIMHDNVYKLFSRRAVGTIHGDGNER